MTADQARQLADSFDSVATSTSKYISDNRQTLTVDQILALAEQMGDLHVAAAQLQGKALGLDLAAAQTSLTALKNLTVVGKKAIREIDKVGKVIVLLTTMVELAGAVAAQNPAAVGQGVIDVVNALKDMGQDPDNPKKK